MVMSFLKGLFSKDSKTQNSTNGRSLGKTPELKKKAELKPAEPNVASDWQETNEWVKWEAPLNVIKGESHYQNNLRKLAGMPRTVGYLIPVAITLTREPTNSYDKNAIRADIGEYKIGYLSKELAAVFAPVIDSVGLKKFAVAGVIRGGSVSAPTLGVHIWMDRRITEGPLVQFAGGSREQYCVTWPPEDDEGKGINIDELDFLPRNPKSRPGFYQDRHFTEYVDVVKQLKRDSKLELAEKLLLALIDATESESKKVGDGVAPWYYEQLAMVYRKCKRVDDEISILERFAKQKHSPGATPLKLLERLEKIRSNNNK